MNNHEWLTKVKSNEDVLKTFIKEWHPTNLVRNSMRITAHNAEAASRYVRAQIRNQAERADPIVRFELALAQSDIIGINNVLNEAWFGVPESTDCWSIKGFREAVELMEDLPEENND